jgi:hypothetical protein
MSTHHISSISRREFVVGSAIAGIGLAMRADAAGIADAEWFDRPMRWAQLTLVENDPGRYDPAFWLDYFRRISRRRRLSQRRRRGCVLALALARGAVAAEGPVARRVFRRRYRSHVLAIRQSRPRAAVAERGPMAAR